MAGAIIAVKGNCDNSQIDGIFNFGLTYIRNITINNTKITLTHGHIYRGGNSKSYLIINEENLVLKKLNGEIIKKMSKNID